MIERNAWSGFGLFALMLASPLAAQGANEHRRTPGAAVATAVRALPAAPKVDGKLDDPVWQTAPRFGGFTQRDPHEGQAGTETTEFQVVYSNDALYIGVRAADSRPEQIAALLSRRDDWSPSDEITVMIDSYYDRRTGFSFTVNAAGVKRDVYLFNDNNEDSRWDAVWDAQVAIDSAGWTAEFRIPFGQLRFSRSPSNTFGFNVSRRITRLNETQQWRLVPKDASGWVSLFGDLTNLAGIEPPRRVEVQPYVAASNFSSPAVAGDPFHTGVDRSASLGGDFKVGVTSGLTLTATINPDFGQVEADPAVVNLSAFESFFAERRPFFTEGLDIFRFRLAEGDGDGANEELFYTRRIGRAPQGEADPRGGYAESIAQTTILGAAKLSGKTRSGWTIGALGAVTQAERARVVDDAGLPHHDPVEPGTGYGVFRLARELRGGQTVIGVFGTTVQRSLSPELDWLHSSAYTGGINWSHRFADNTYQLSGRVVGSRVDGSPEAIARTQQSSTHYYQRPDAEHLDYDPTRTSLSGYTVALNGGRTAGNWRFSVGGEARSPGFEVNDLGFQRESDRLNQFIWINRRWLTPGSVFRRFNLNLNQWAGWTYGGERRYFGANFNANFTTLNYWGGWFGLNRNVEGLSTTALRGGPSIRTPGNVNGWFGFSTDDRRAVSADVFGNFNVRDEGAGHNAGVGFGLAWRPSSNVELRLGPNFNYNRDAWQYLDTPTVEGEPVYLFGELTQRTASMTLRSNVTFSPSLSLQVYAQPFVSSGSYQGFKQVTAPRADRFADRFDPFGEAATRGADGEVTIDVDRDGATDLTLENPDFTVLSLRSNVVLRWEYLLGSTLFLVWQHGRSDYLADGRFRFGERVGDIFRSPSSNVLLVKLNYWLSL
ncbi:MAG: DUF5916 domain-containing protein [Gemmatimonadales bacterium]